MTVGRTYGEQNFSPLKKINDRNVGKLGLAWYADIDTDRGVEAAPLEVDGVLYNIAPWNITTAYDAKTGRELWTYDPKVQEQTGRLACCDIVSRGVAVWNGKVYVAALDGRLIALDARDGKPVWSVQTLQGTGNQHYTVTGAPRVFDGKVLIGNAGAENALRGYVTAYDAETGKQLWRFYTVPGDPAKGYKTRAMAMAAKTWKGDWWKRGGGGTVWDAMAYDPELHMVYFGTGNAAPWVPKFRGGVASNLFTVSIVALNVDTGQYVWHYQEVPGDEWDYDANQSIILADLTIDGKVRKVLMQAPKDGFFYVLDRTNGKLISAKKYTAITWAKGIDLKTGRPIVNPAARYGAKPVMVAPGAGGGHNFNPMAFSPITRLAYFPAAQTFMGYSAADTYKSGTGASFTGAGKEREKIADYADAHEKSWLEAWDPARQKEAWRVPYPRKGSGGVLVTAGNLVFEGTIGETLAAYRATDGKKLWDAPVQNVPIGSPMTYTIDGVQYIAVNAGWGGGLAHVESNRFRDLHLSKARLLVFKLGGTQQLPPMPKAVALQPPPPSTASPQTIAVGAKLYAQNCATCHGAEALGGVKDLRQMSPEAHKMFLDIVLGGALKKSGMASFADLLTKTDAEAIHAYLIQRANQYWKEQHGP